jgi:ribosome biogenesis GTPase / thiamine phosphate phosphatase
MENKLKPWGWDTTWQELFQHHRQAALPHSAAWQPARVVSEHPGLYQLITAQGLLLIAPVSGRLRHNSHTRTDFPAVGDWVAYTQAGNAPPQIELCLTPRRTLLTRKASDRDPEPQPMAANVDHLWIMASLDRQFKVRRLERFLQFVTQGGFSAEVLLSKADDPLQAARYEQQYRPYFTPYPVHSISLNRPQSLEVLAPSLAKPQTIFLLGASGVGKSSLVNHLLGRLEQKTSAVMAHWGDRGRHTTTVRRLLILPHGALLIDSPGLREVGFQEEAHIEDLKGFTEILTLAKGCRFRNCTHGQEPGCAVSAAVKDGQMSAQRLAHFQKLQTEHHSANSRIPKKYRPR